MKNIILFILFLLPATITSAQNKIDSILNVLDKVVEKRDIYFMSREIRIDSLKQCLKGTNEVHEKYDISTDCSMNINHINLILHMPTL